jgi:cyanate lyase
VLRSAQEETVKKKGKKLVLSTETLRVLDSSRLPGPMGGAFTPPCPISYRGYGCVETEYNTCPTYLC